MTDESMACPECGTDCQREEVDVGVGVIYGPWGCPSCAWSEGLLTQFAGFDQYGNYHPLLDPGGRGWAEREAIITAAFTR